jgi:general secretion pathway protein G
MIELIFVIVILGILAAIALPKFASTREMAEIAKGRGDVAMIRAAIANERQTQVIKGIYTYISKLSPLTTSTTLFTGDGAGRVLLSYGIKAGTDSGDWAIVNNTTYRFKVGSTDTTFTYEDTNGTFTCVADAGNCNELSD